MVCNFLKVGNYEKIALLMLLGAVSIFADTKADGYNFCSDQEFKKPVKYIAIKDTSIYFDACKECKAKGGIKKLKKGTVVNVIEIGHSCGDSTDKTVYMNIQLGEGWFNGVVASDFKKL
jgi:hypothetical protein